MKRKFSLDNLLHSNLVLTLIAIAFAFVVGGVFLQCIVSSAGDLLFRYTQ